ncbi:MAG: hypothetical protein K2M12_00865 [Muribaculaceae bacterium]|nr:hypothetical protein [Muribaculaceae bacterium]
MNIRHISYSLVAATMLASCADEGVKAPEETGGKGDVILSISYSTDDFGPGLLRSRSDIEETLCWSDWNEKKVNSLDFYLIGADGKISFYKKLENTSDDCGVPHTVVEFSDGANSNVADLTFEKLNASSGIYMVANHPLGLSGSERIGKSFDDLYADALAFTDNQYREQQNQFVMVGFFKLPTEVSEYSRIVVPLRRIIAKIRVSVKHRYGGADGEPVDVAPGDFRSMLCRYGSTVRVMPDELMPTFSHDGQSADFSNIWPATDVTLAGSFANSDWDYPEDITVAHPWQMIRGNGHVYYSCPTDWVDYSKLKRQCSRKGNTGHNDADHDAGNRYEITDCDDTAPINEEREMFLLIKAPYAETQGEKTTDYFYRVPLNYRITNINDQQCFSEADLTDKVFGLYRVQRNHFYDITVLLDRPGAVRPNEAVAPSFLLQVADLTDGGTYDYYY